MWLLAFGCSAYDCGHLGQTRDEVAASLRDIPGETGHHTFTGAGDTLTVTVTGIPDDAVSGRTLLFTFAPDATGIERVATCAARDQCARGWSLGACP